MQRIDGVSTAIQHGIIESRGTLDIGGAQHIA
jgi:hypothetical protein